MKDLWIRTRSAILICVAIAGLVATAIGVRAAIICKPGKVKCVGEECMCSQLASAGDDCLECFDSIIVK